MEGDKDKSKAAPTDTEKGANKEAGSGDAEDDSVVIKDGKRYNRIQIEGLGDDEEYLMDSEGGIYSLDF